MNSISLDYKILSNISYIYKRRKYTYVNNERNYFGYKNWQYYIKCLKITTNISTFICFFSYSHRKIYVGCPFLVARLFQLRLSCLFKKNSLLKKFTCWLIHQHLKCTCCFYDYYWFNYFYHLKVHTAFHSIKSYNYFTD